MEQWFVIDCPEFVSLNCQLAEVKGCDWVWSYDVMTSDNLFILSMYLILDFFFFSFFKNIFIGVMKLISS